MNAVRLEVRDGDETIVCRVSREALEALIGREAARPGDLLKFAYDYYELLTDKWALRIELGVCDLDGSVFLRRSDVT